jgi:hypothetical protein
MGIVRQRGVSGKRPAAGRGSLWHKTLATWFAVEPEPDTAAGTPGIEEHLRRAMASGDGFAGGAGAYAFSAAGERAIRAGAAFI